MCGEIPVGWQDRKFHHSLPLTSEKNPETASLLNNDHRCIQSPQANDDGQSSQYEDSDGDLHLLQCKDVDVEMRQGALGVKYSKDGEDGWTKVVRRKKKRKAACANVSGDSEIDVRGSRDTHYDVRENTPGLYIRKGCTNRNISWTPIKPHSPYSLRPRM